MNNLQVIHANYQLNSQNNHRMAPQPVNTKIQITYAQQNTYLASKTAYQISSNMQPSQPFPLSQDQSIRKQPKNSLFQQQKQAVPINNNIYLLMKEQIDIAAFNYREKMNKALQQQAKEIQNLTHIVIRHKEIITRQAQVINNINKNQQTVSKSRYSPTNTRQNSKINSKSPSKISLTQRRTSTKQTSPFKEPQNNNMQSKIIFLKTQIQDLDKKLKEGMTFNKEVMYKIVKMQQVLKSDLSRKISTGQQRINAFIKLNEQKLNRFDFKIDNKLNDIANIKGKVQFLQDEMQQIKQLTYNIKNRQYKYDSYQLKLLEAQIAQLKEQIQELSYQKKKVQDRHEKQEQRYEPSFIDGFDVSQKNYLKVLESNSVNHSKGLTRRHSKLQPRNRLQISQLSSMTHYSPKYREQRDKERVRISNEWQMEDSQSNFSEQQDDEFFYPEEDQNEQQSKESRLNRFRDVLVKQFKNLPVQVQIDQTGYIKYFDSGMYILDENGDGFDLNGEEISYLKSKGVIVY